MYSFLISSPTHITVSGYVTKAINNFLNFFFALEDTANYQWTFLSVSTAFTYSYCVSNFLSSHTFFWLLFFIHDSDTHLQYYLYYFIIFYNGIQLSKFNDYRNLVWWKPVFCNLSMTDPMLCNFCSIQYSRYIMGHISHIQYFNIQIRIL